jgi:hypothetical protein
MFERFVLLEREELEIGRRYIQAFGLPQAAAVLLEDMNAGRLPWGRARTVLKHMPYLVIEYLCRRLGFTRFRDVCTDPEFVTLQGGGVAQLLERHGAVLDERHAQALEDFTWQALRHWHLVAHDMAGRHTYEVAPSLAHALRQPERMDRPWKAPGIPVPAVLLVVPAEAQLTLAQWGAAPRAVTELYVVESPPPQRQWSIWIHAPVDEDFAQALFVELPLPVGASLEDGLEHAIDVFQGEAPSAQGWKECVRWLAAAVRSLSERNSPLESRVLQGSVGLLH